jgi:hypothetical protein
MCSAKGTEVNLVGHAFERHKLGAEADQTAEHPSPVDSKADEPV